MSTPAARQSFGSRLKQWMTRIAVNRTRRKGRFMGMDVLVLTTVGKKSGIERATPVAWFPGEGDSWIITATAAGGPRNPAWYYNLSADPDHVQIDVEGRHVEVIALSSAAKNAMRPGSRSSRPSRASPGTRRPNGSSR